MSQRDAYHVRASYKVVWRSFTGAFENAEVFLTLKRANKFAGKLRARGERNIYMEAL